MLDPRRRGIFLLRGRDEGKNVIFDDIFIYRNHGLLCELKQMIVSGYGRLPGYQVLSLSLSLYLFISPYLYLSIDLLLYKLKQMNVSDSHWVQNRLIINLWQQCIEGEKEF